MAWRRKLSLLLSPTTRLSTTPHLKPYFPSPSPSSSLSSTTFRALIFESSTTLHRTPLPSHPCSCRSFCFRSLGVDADSQGPTAIDYSSVLQENEFHKLADSTIHDLQEKLEEYGDVLQIDGFDIDYGNEVLTLKLGDLGTYVLNKQTPNRQLWLSSPVSGPSRFDWDQNARAWIYRRTKANLLNVLESELEQLCSEPIKLA